MPKSKLTSSTTKNKGLNSPLESMTSSKPTMRGLSGEVTAVTDKVTDLTEVTQRIENVQSELKEEQRWQKDILLIGWIVMLVTVVGVVVTLGAVMLDFFYYKNNSTQSEASKIPDINIYLHGIQEVRNAEAEEDSLESDFKFIK